MARKRQDNSQARSEPRLPGQDRRRAGQGAVNGRFLSGAKPFEEFVTLINQELQKKGLPVPAGVQG